MSRPAFSLACVLALVGVAAQAAPSVDSCTPDVPCFELENTLAWDPYHDTRAARIHLYFRDTVAASWTAIGSTEPAVGGPRSFVSRLVVDTTSPCTTTLLRFIARAATVSGVESADSELARVEWILWQGSTLRGAVLCATGNKVDICALYPCGCAGDGCVCVPETSP